MSSSSTEPPAADVPRRTFLSVDRSGLVRLGVAVAFARGGAAEPAGRVDVRAVHRRRRGVDHVLRDTRAALAPDRPDRPGPAPPVRTGRRGRRAAPRRGRRPSRASAGVVPRAGVNTRCAHSGPAASVKLGRPPSRAHGASPSCTRAVSRVTTCAISGIMHADREERERRVAVRERAGHPAVVEDLAAQLAHLHHRLRGLRVGTHQLEQPVGGLQAGTRRAGCGARAAASGRSGRCARRRAPRTA